MQCSNMKINYCCNVLKLSSRREVQFLCRWPLHYTHVKHEIENLKEFVKRTAGVWSRLCRPWEILDFFYFHAYLHFVSAFKLPL